MNILLKENKFGNSLLKPVELPVSKNQLIAMTASGIVTSQVKVTLVASPSCGRRTNSVWKCKRVREIIQSL